MYESPLIERRNAYSQPTKNQQVLETYRPAVQTIPIVGGYDPIVSAAMQQQGIGELIPTININLGNQNKPKPYPTIDKYTLIDELNYQAQVGAAYANAAYQALGGIINIVNIGQFLRPSPTPTRPYQSNPNNAVRPPLRDPIRHNPPQPGPYDAVLGGNSPPSGPRPFDAVLGGNNPPRPPLTNPPSGSPVRPASPTRPPTQSPQLPKPPC